MKKCAEIEISKKESDSFKCMEQCYVCQGEFTKSNYKVRDHCHRTGKYRGPHASFGFEVGMTWHYQGITFAIANFLRPRGKHYLWWWPLTPAAFTMLKGHMV